MKQLVLTGFLLISAISCDKLPTEPEPQLLVNTSKLEKDQKLLRVELWAGRVNYAANIGGHEWRATFELKVILPSGENISNQCTVEFFWKRDTPLEVRWINGTSFYKHALTSIDGHWLDDSSLLNPPWLMKARISIPQIKFKTSVVGKCNFLVEIEKPDRTWVSNTDMEYGVGDRILASTEAVYNKL